MKIINIALRTPLNSNTLRLSLYRFFKNTKFKGQYILVFIKFTNSQNVQSKSLGIMYPIDLNNPTYIKQYKKEILKQFDSKFTTYSEELIRNMHINYKEISKEDYDSLVAKISKSVNIFDNVIDEGIPNDLNIPYNINYSTWGEQTIVSKSSYIIENCEFNDTIEKLLITHEGHLTTVLIIFKAEGTKKVHFIDSSWSKGIKRVFFDADNVETKTIYFSNIVNKLMFYVDKAVLPKVYKLDKEGKKTNIRTKIVNKNLSYSDIEMKLLKTGSTVQFEIPKFNVITLDIETYLEEVKDKKK